MKHLLNLITIPSYWSLSSHKCRNAAFKDQTPRHCHKHPTSSCVFLAISIEHTNPGVELVFRTCPVIQSQYIYIYIYTCSVSFVYNIPFQNHLHRHDNWLDDLVENSQVADALKYNHYNNKHRFHIKLLSPGARHILHRQSFNFAIELIVKIIDISLTKLYGMRLQFRYVVEDFFLGTIQSWKDVLRMY